MVAVDLETYLYVPCGSTALLALTTYLLAAHLFGVMAGKKKVTAGTGFLVLLAVLNFLAAAQFDVHENGAVLVTGTSTGIGHDAAVELDKKGFTVFAGVRKESDMKLVQEACSSRVKPILLDVTKSEQIEAAFETIKSSGVPLVGVVNNAGVAKAGPIETRALSDVDKVLSVNLRGVWEITQKAIPLLRKNKGRLVNIGSMYGRFAPASCGSYCVSKFGLESLSDSLRREMTAIGNPVSISLVDPGYIDTPLVRNGAADLLGHAKTLEPEPKATYNGMLDVFGKGVCVQPLLWVSNVQMTSNAIVHAITSPYPMSRYTVGLDAKLAE